MERRLALQDRLDQLDAYRGGWLAPTLAGAFVCVLLASGLDSVGWVATTTAAAVAGVPFIRLARSYVERLEWRGLERLLANTAPAPRLPTG